MDKLITIFEENRNGAHLFPEDNKQVAKKQTQQTMSSNEANDRQSTGKETHGVEK